MNADGALLAAAADHVETYHVDAARLDDAMSELHFGEIFFVKGDGEGAEPEVRP
jgi:hypothetical protein